MNRPTLEVEDLLDMADEAISAGDQSQAIMILRKAAAIAPLRRDIKNRLALALEGTPVVAKPARTSPQFTKEVQFDEEPAAYHEQEYELPQSGSGMESISQIARKAFDAAAQQKVKASDAKRRLTNLLQTGLDNWKSSLASSAATPTSKSESIETPATTAQSIVFRPEEELKQYLNRNEPEVELADEMELPGQEDEARPSRITKPVPTSKKSVAAPAGKCGPKRPTDVEDVLAAGIGGFIEAFGRTDKTKIIYGIVYFGLISLFGYACFDVSRKFPQLTKANSAVNTASLSVNTPLLIETETLNSTEAVTRARSLAVEGKLSDAAELLRTQLASGRLLQNRDLVRVELATVLNSLAEAELKANRLGESVTAYRKAVSHLPTDQRLQLRLANALYYQGVMGTASDKNQSAVLLNEAGTLLSELVRADSKNIQAHRLQALVYEAADKQTLARTSWQKVKSLAPADSPILAEAKSRLK